MSGRGCIVTLAALLLCSGLANVAHADDGGGPAFSFGFALPPIYAPPPPPPVYRAPPPPPVYYAPPPVYYYGPPYWYYGNGDNDDRDDD